MVAESAIRQGQILTGPLFNEPMRVVTNCASVPQLQEPIQDPARFPWHEVTQVAHYYLSVDTLKQPPEIREDLPTYRAR